jgi:hypothetical protein
VNNAEKKCWAEQLKTRHTQNEPEVHGVELVLPGSHGNPEAQKVRKRKGQLPAVAAIAAIAAIPTTSAATATAIATIASATTTTAAAVSTTSAAATRAFGLGTRFIHNKIPAAKILTVQAGHGAIRFFIVSNFDESEAARLPSETITNQTDG